MFKVRQVFTFPPKRFASTSKLLEHLPNRNLIRVSGPEADVFLQGLITNDIAHLNSRVANLYTMFLNTAGRVLFDSIIYRSTEQNTFLVECDSAISELLEKHLKQYRVRRKIDVNISDDLNVHVLFQDSEQSQFSDKDSQDKGKNGLDEDLIKCDIDVSAYPDPRLSALGIRLISRSDINLNERINEKIITSKGDYRRLRYSLGVGEGVEDLPLGDCFPLESNGDYLHGVSFQKGCYIGQELTARIYHTGVIRKRLMPIHFKKIPSKLPDAKIVHKGVNLGKLRGIEKDTGLALLRIDKALAFNEINIGDGIGVTCKPNWWPLEAPKTKANISKAQ